MRIEEQLRARGASAADTAEADLVVVNTCSVTASADQGARQAIRRIARDNPAARVVVTGCYAARRPDDVAALPNVVRIVGNDEKEDLVRLLGYGDGPCGAAIEPGIAGRTAFTLRVQTGCEERCSFCIIPTTRGPGRSSPLDRVKAEVDRAVAAGFREIVLTGVHLGSYGRDLAPRQTLLALLETLGAIDADVTFRISSLEPMDCSPEIVVLVAESRGRFAPHFHLPLQHASDRLLERMRRPYTIAYYRSLVESIVEAMPHASIGSDVIAGFPGEQDEDFERTLEYLAASPLSHIHVFPYSDRPGTEASALSGKVPGAIVRDRCARLRAVGRELSERFRKRQSNTLRPGLTLEDGTLVVTDNFLKVRVAPGLERNRRVDVLLTEEAGTVVRAY